jgi:hypothetical protein
MWLQEGRAAVWDAHDAGGFAVTRLVDKAKLDELPCNRMHARWRMQAN